MLNSDYDSIAPPWVEAPTHDLDCDLPLSRRLTEPPKRQMQRAKLLLEDICSQIPKRLWLIADWINLRTGWRFYREIRAAAKMADVPWRDLMMANVSYDLSMIAMGCSTVVLPTPDGPVTARNMDWFPEDLLAQASCLTRYYRKGKLHFANAGWPGSLGVVTGMSGRGFSVVLNAAFCREKTRYSGHPVLLLLRRVIEEAKDFDDALKRLKDTKLITSALFTLAGVENHQRVVIERTPTRHALRWADGDRPLITTNHYCLLKEEEADAPFSDGATGDLYLTACFRFDWLRDFFRDHSPRQTIDDATLLYALTDPNVIQSITAQHIIMRPKLGEIRMLAPRHLVEMERFA